MQLPAPGCSTEQVAVATNFSSDSVDWLNHSEPGTRVWVTIKELAGKDGNRARAHGESKNVCSPGISMGCPNVPLIYGPSLPSYD